MPEGHWQVGLCDFVIHVAKAPHGFSVLHGFKHLRFLQAWLSGHSESDEHPSSIGAALKKDKRCSNGYQQKMKKKHTDFVTSDIPFAGISNFTRACHSSSRQSVIDLAYSIGHTRTDFQAWIFANAWETCLFARTITISLTSLINNRFWNYYFCIEKTRT